MQLASIVLMVLIVCLLLLVLDCFSYNWRDLFPGIKLRFTIIFKLRHIDCVGERARQREIDKLSTPDALKFQINKIDVGFRIFFFQLFIRPGLFWISSRTLLLRLTNRIFLCRVYLWDDDLYEFVWIIHQSMKILVFCTK